MSSNRPARPASAQPSGIQTTEDAFVEAICGMLAAEPDELAISTFNCWLGIMEDGTDTSEWGSKYVPATRQIVEQAGALGVPIRLLVGIHDFEPCKPGCRACRHDSYKKLARIPQTAKRFTALTVRAIGEHHLKCVISDHGDHQEVLIGGRNFSGSSWTDATVTLSHGGGPIVELFEDSWEQAMGMNELAHWIGDNFAEVS